MLFPWIAWWIFPVRFHSSLPGRLGIFSMGLSSSRISGDFPASEGLKNQFKYQWEFQDPKMEVPTIYLRPIFQAYVSEYHDNSYGQIYGTNVPPCIGSWNAHWKYV